MDPSDKVRAQSSMHRPVTCNAIFSCKFSASEHDIEVALTCSRGARVARMAGAVIHNFDLARVKCGAQFVFDFLPNGRFS